MYLQMIGGQSNFMQPSEKGGERGREGNCIVNYDQLLLDCINVKQCISSCCVLINDYDNRDKYIRQYELHLRFPIFFMHQPDFYFKYVSPS